jgi:lysozyme family protein
MTEEQLIDDVFAKEGDTYGDKDTKPPIDQPTARGGIILPTLQAYYDVKEPGRRANVLELKQMTHGQARAVVRWKLAQIAAKAGLDRIVFAPLRFQMVDFAYNSGDGLAIRWLQRVLRVPRTGKMDALTFDALSKVDQWLVHQALIAARLQMIDGATDPGGKVDKRFEEGLENRALTFSLLQVP